MFRRNASYFAKAEAVLAAAERDAALEALTALVQAVDELRCHVVVPSGTIARTPVGQDLAVRAPHVQDPRLARAMRDAVQVLEGGEG